MLLRLLAIILLVPALTVVTGCACPSGCRVPGTPSAPCPGETSVVEGDPPDLVELVSADCQLVPLPSPSETYELLSASTCQCNAATNANLANLVELERHWAKVVIECDTKNVRENYCLDRDLLALHAYDLRNTSASTALEAFYQLAGLEAQQHYLLQGIDETERTLERVDKLRSEGLELPERIERSTIVAKLNELRDQKLQLEFLRIQLNGQLQQLIGCPLNEHAFYWPQIDWTPDLTPVDVELELADGLATRSDLRGLALVLCKLKKPTLPVARGVLSFADSTLGTVEPVDGWIHAARCFRCNEHEVPVRCRQLSMFYAETEKLATAEIKSAAYKVNLQQQRVVVVQQSVQEIRRQLFELEETRDVNEVTVFELSNLRGQLYEAESNLISQVVALKLAEVGLGKAQGVLALECGFEPVLCCEGCCDGDCCSCLGKNCKQKNCSKCAK
ncbi:MAG: hypothetical protein KDA57_12510 [Planctomycetales bacterium]|nr:hypothetical protein [Planctomycetales bacterium]